MTRLVNQIETILSDFPGSACCVLIFSEDEKMKLQRIGPKINLFSWQTISMFKELSQSGISGQGFEKKKKSLIPK